MARSGHSEALPLIQSTFTVISAAISQPVEHISQISHYCMNIAHGQQCPACAGG